jgi:hypothetical protein
MRKPRGTFRLVLLSLLGIGWSVASRAETPPRTHVTIRGTGNDISIERSEIRPPRPESVPAAAAPSVLDEAIRMKEAGMADEALVGYLRAHASSLPSFIDFDTVTRLRAAGAGRSVIAYLAGAAAVEIGPTGAVGGASASEPEYEPVDEAPYGIPTFGGYGGYGGYGGTSRHSGSRFFRKPPVSRPAMRPFTVPTPFPPVVPTRRPTVRMTFHP